MSNNFWNFFAFILLNFTARHTNSACEKGWASFGGKCYFFLLDQMNFQAAMTACYEAGADVLEFHNPYEEKWIDLQCRLRGYAAGVWLGISDLQQEGNFISVSEARPPRYLKWAKGEPTNSGSNEHCAYYYYTWRGLVDVQCTSKYNAVCKK